MPKPQKTKKKVLSKKKIKEMRYFTEFGAHLGIGGKLLASLLDSHEQLRANSKPSR